MFLLVTWGSFGLSSLLAIPYVGLTLDRVKYDSFFCLFYLALVKNFRVIQGVTVGYQNPVLYVPNYNRIVN